MEQGIKYENECGLTETTSSVIFDHYNSFGMKISKIFFWIILRYLVYDLNKYQYFINLRALPTLWKSNQIRVITRMTQGQKKIQQER